MRDSSDASGRKRREPVCRGLSSLGLGCAAGGRRTSSRLEHARRRRDISGGAHSVTFSCRLSQEMGMKKVVEDCRALELQAGDVDSRSANQSSIDRFLKRGSCDAHTMAESCARLTRDAGYRRAHVPDESARASSVRIATSVPDRAGPGWADASVAGAVETDAPSQGAGVDPHRGAGRSLL